MRKFFLAALLVAALGSFIWLVLRPHEPVYQGKPLSFWLEGYDPRIFNQRPPPPTWSKADEAVLAIGTNAIPRLLRVLQQSDSEFMFTMLRLLPPQIRASFASVNRNMKAFLGFYTLGPAASNAVPRLIEMFDRDPSPFLQQAVPVIFGNMGPAAAPAIPALLRGITHTNEIVRNNILLALGEIHAEPALVVPALIKCLNDPDTSIRAKAAHSLGEFGYAAHSAVPALIELLQRETLDTTNGAGDYIVTSHHLGWKGMGHSPYSGRSLSSVIKDALRSIDPEAAAKAGVE